MCVTTDEYIYIFVSGLNVTKSEDRNLPETKESSTVRKQRHSRTRVHILRNTYGHVPYKWHTFHWLLEQSGDYDGLATLQDETN
jgi:hypothetical protein